MTTIFLRKQGPKIRVENKVGLHLADISENDVEFYEPVIDSELKPITIVKSNFHLFHENIIAE